MGDPVYREKPATSGPGQEVRHGCRSRISALPRATPSMSGSRCWANGGQASGNWGRGIVPEGIPAPGYSGPPLATRCAGEHKMNTDNNKTPTSAVVEVDQLGQEAMTTATASGRSHISRERNTGDMNTLVVPQSRRSSVASSLGSEFSHATACDIEGCEQEWAKVLKIREEIHAIFAQGEQLLKDMSAACKVQKNVNNTVKEGIPRLAYMFSTLKHLHKQEESDMDSFHRGVGYTHEARDARKRIRSRIQGRLLKDAVLAASSSAPDKRPRSPSESSDERTRDKAKAKKKKKKQKNAETAAAEVLPVVMVTRPDQETVAMKPKAKPKTSAGPSSVLVKVASGQTYAGVLGRIRKDINPDTCSARIVCARPTPKGDVILRLGKGSDRAKFAAALGAAVGDTGNVIAPEKRVSVEVRDLDSLTEAHEVVDALDRVLGGPSDKRRVSLGPANKRLLKLAVLDLSEEEATKLLKLGHLRVGYLSCAVRLRTVVTRCFRCLGYGHRRSECTGVDRSNLCYKCGESGHHHKECTGAPRCFLCSELDPVQCEHVAGSGACTVFRLALVNAKKAESQLKKKPPRRKGK